MRGLKAALTLATALFTAPLALAAETARFNWLDYQGADPSDAVVKAKPGEYRNPILTGYYPDPSITRVGDDYYIVNSTFSWFPGIPIFHSRDLVNWTQIGNAIDRPDQLDFKALGLSRGVFAPAIDYHDGTFYILNTCVDCGGNFIITAQDPKGPWSNPIWLPDLEGGIDPSIYFEGDRAWIINNGPPEGEPLYQGHRAIWVQELDLKSMKTIGPRKVLVNGGVDISKKPIWIEGPHIFKKDGFYYLICAEGGTAINHSQVVLRGPGPMGPFTPNPANPILTQRDLDPARPFPVTSAGHADFVVTPKGEWWASFLAIRPYGDDLYNTGRETFLMPVRWVDGWPRITEPGQAIPLTHAKPDLPAQPAPKVPTTGAFQVRDEFDGDRLPPYWMMARNPKGDWYRLSDGALTLKLQPVGLSDHGNPAFWARRQQHHNATIITDMVFTPDQPGERAGLAAVQSDESWMRFTIEKEGGQLVARVAARAGKDTPADGQILGSVPVKASASYRLRITARGGEYDFDVAAAGADWQPVVKGADGTILSTKKAGGFIGVMVGPFAQGPGKGN